MMNWYEKPGAGWLLRLGGLVLIGSAVLASMTLYHLVHAASPHAATPVELLLALLGFGCASAGSTAAVLGRHLFDQVEISSRWARSALRLRDQDDPTIPRP